MTEPSQSPQNDNELASAYLAGAPDAIIVVDGDGTMTMVNKQAEALFGYDRSELLGHSVDMLIPENIRPSHEAHRRRYADEARVRPMGDAGSRVRGRTKDGTLVPIDVALSPLSGAAGAGAIAIVRDLRPRLATEAAHEIVRRTLDAVDDAVFMFDPETLQFTYANEGAQSQVGYDRYVLIGGKTLMDIAPQFSEGDIRELVSGLLDGTESSVALTTTHQHQDGHTVPVEILFHYPFVSETAPRMLVAIVRDITERQAAEDQRDRREHLLASLADVRRATMMEAPIDDVLRSLLTATRELLAADHAFVAVRSIDGALSYRAMSSSITQDQSGLPVPDYPLIQQVLNDGKARAVAALSESGDLLHNEVDAPYEFGPGFVAPLIASGSLEGVFVAARPLGEKAFSVDEIAIGSSLASEIAVSMDLARARSDRSRIFLVEDRERIARDLHDVVIQRLLAAGMGLQASLGNPTKLNDRATTTIDELDGTIDVIRETIFHLTQPDLSFEGAIRRVIDRYRTVGRNDVTYAIDGEIEALSDAIGANLIPTITELLSNIERHAEANTATVALVITNARLTLTVVDDGCGIDDTRPLGFGIRNITNRAEFLGGSVVIEAGPEGVGTSVTWTVPLSS